MGRDNFFVLQADALLLFNLQLQSNRGTFQGRRALAHNLCPASVEAIRFHQQLEKSNGGLDVSDGSRLAVAAVTKLEQALAPVLDDTLQAVDGRLALGPFLDRIFLLNVELGAFLHKFCVLEVDL